MRGSSLRQAVAIGLLATTLGCGGGETGARGGSKAGGSGGTANQAPATRPSLRTVVYLPTYHGTLATWQRNLAFEHVSYVDVSFADIDRSGAVRFPDPGLASFVQKAHSEGVKVCVALGGATTIEDGGVFATLLEDASRPAFVEKLAVFAANNQLDCLDVDLEGNGVNQFYEAFVTELSARLAVDGRELTAAVAGWFADGITDKALASFAFVNVMAYDLYSSIEVPMQTSSIEAATRQVDNFAARMGKDRVVYGVPFYGMQWPTGGGQPEIIGYGDLLRRNAAVETQDQLQGDGTITYLNSRVTIQAKAKLAQQYGGIMVWEAGQDATGDASLLRAIHEAVP